MQENTRDRLLQGQVSKGA